MNENLIRDLQTAIDAVEKPYNKIIFFCIGTDRSTGDSYGPLVGHMLKKRLNNPNIEVYGTLHNPIHAQNLEENLNSIDTKNNLIIAVDACAGRLESVGKIEIKNKPMNPGSAMDKDLPSVGDISIKGILNISGDFLFIRMQNTRLSIVYDLSTLTANTIISLFNQENIKEAAYI